MSSTSNFDDSTIEPFDWNKYLTIRNSEEVPEDFFFHICKSEQNGIEVGSVVEVENEDQNSYWFASVCSSKGVIINLHYIGDENDKHDFWLELKSSRIHPLNWGSENNKKLVPPYPDRFLRVNSEVIKEKVQYCENVVPNSVLQMKGAPIYNIFKPGMFVEVQDKEYPYRVWISKILKNVGGRLFVKMLGVSSPEETPFWLFYSNERIFPLGWADQKGLPWRVMNVDVNIEESTNDSSLLVNVLKPKFPEQHSYKVGDMLEVINPYSLMVFYVATIVKIYDNRYFKVEMNNDSDTEKRITFVATKENPYLFNAGWADKHKFLLKPPSDWDSSDKFYWSKYTAMKNSRLAQVDNACRKKMGNIHIGMKLEAVDPVNPDHIRVATVKGFADNWIFLSFDRSNWCQELLHVRSIYSDDIFPIGWCNKHKYSIGTPKIPFTDCNSFENHYYASDIDMDFNESHTELLTKYPNYFKGEIPYHYSQKDGQTCKDDLEESIQNILNNSCVNIPSTKTEDNNVVTEPIIHVKVEQTKLDEKFREALFLEVDNKAEVEEDNAEVEEDNAEEEDKEKKKEKKEDEKEEKEEEKNVVTKKKVNLKKKKKVKQQIKTFYKNSYKMCIYFNKNCSTNNHFIKKKIAKIPNCIGPGPVSTILHQALTLFVKLEYVPSTALRKIKKNQSSLFNGPGGVTMVITAQNTRTRSNYSEQLLLPESKKMAQIYCSTLCRLTGVCECFMTTEKTVCPHCIVNKKKKLKLETNTVQTNAKPMKRKAEFGVSTSSKKHGNEIIYEQISKVAAEELDWSNKALVERYKYYMACIINYEAHVKRLSESLTQHELALLIEIETKKAYLRDMDDIAIYSNTKSELDKVEEKEFPFIKDWKTSFENFYRKSPVYKNTIINIDDFEHIQVTSNPKFWSPDDVYKYLSNDKYCTDIKKVLLLGQVDGVAFMLLNEEQLVYRLKYSINLAIRVMCHVAYVKHTLLTKYNNH